jgi:hypothetical protein
VILLKSGWRKGMEILQEKHAVREETPCNRKSNEEEKRDKVSLVFVLFVYTMRHLIHVYLTYENV